MEATTLKFRVWFQDDLQHAVRTGLSTRRMEVCLRTLERMWRADTRGQTGEHSIIKYMMQRAPSLSLPQLADRTTIKQALGPRKAGVQGSPSQAAASVIEPCVERADTFQEVLSTQARWEATRAVALKAIVAGAGDTVDDSAPFTLLANTSPVVIDAMLWGTGSAKRGFRR